MFPNYAELCKQTAVLIWWVVKIIWYIAFTMIWCSLKVAYMLIILSIWIGLKVYCYNSSRQSPVTVTEDIRCKATTASVGVIPGTSHDRRKCKGDIPVKVSSSTSRNTSESWNSRISHNSRCDRPTLVSSESTVPNVSDRKAFETPSFSQQEKTNRPSKKDNQVYNQMSTDNPEKSASIETTLQESCQSIHTSIDRPIATGSTAITCPTKLSSYAVSESLSATSLSSSSSSYVVVSCKQDAVMSAAAPRGHSLSSTSAAGEINPAIMSSVRSSMSASINSPSNTTANGPKKSVPVAASRNTSESSNSKISQNLRCDRPTLVSTENTVPIVSDRKTFETPSFSQQEKTKRPSKKDSQVYNQMSTDNPEESASIETTRQGVCQSMHTSIDRPIATGSTAITCPAKLSSYAVSKSLTATSSSSSSSSYVVVSGKQDAVMSAAAPRGQSLSSRSAAGEINLAIMSSVRNSLSACTSSPSNTTASSPKKSVPVAAVRTNANLQACGAVKSRDTSKMAEHKSTAATIAIESTCISATPASGGPTNHDARAKRLDSVDKCAKSDGNVCTSSSPLQSSDNTSSNGQPDCDTSIADTSHSSAPSVASTDTTQTEERARFPLSEEYKFRLVCDICFKPKTEQMTGVGVHGCRQDMLAVKEVGTSQWRWIRQRKPYINFRGDYAMCIKRRDGRPNICYSGCTYAHCDAERRLWNLEKKSAFSISEFITANQTSAPICDVKSLLDKYPVSRLSFSHF